MSIKIINSLLILFVVYMGFRQGWSMLRGEPRMLITFSQWHFNKKGLMLFGVITLLSTALIFSPQTFFWGNFLMAAAILFIICLQLSVKNTKGALIEVPFLLVNLLIIYFQYPLSKHIK